MPLPPYKHKLKLNSIFFLLLLPTSCYSCHKMKRVGAEKLSVSLPRDIAAWLKRGAKQKRVSVSFFLRLAIEPAFEQRHKS